MNHYLIGITGGSGSGKSTILQEIRKKFSMDEVCIICQDDYYMPRDKQYIDENGIQNFDLPSGIFLDDLYEDILKLMNDQTVVIREYTFNNKNKKPRSKSIVSAPIIVIEGLFVYYHTKIKNLLNLKLFVQASDVNKIIRRIKRDLHERNYSMEDVLYRYERHVLPSYNRYIEPYMSECDIILNNDFHYQKGLVVIMDHIQVKLKELRLN